MEEENEQNDNISDEMVVVKPGNHSYYLHYILKDNLDGVKHEVLKKDYDGFFVVDGPEGYGKSTLAMQCATYLDPTFNLSRVVFTIDQFVEVVETAKKGEAIVFDETMGYLGARGAMTKFNRSLIKIFSEMRSKNLFIFLCIPSFFELDKYPAIHRSISLLHVYKRGKFLAFNYSAKKLLYINGKKYYSYKNPSADFHGDFIKYFPLIKTEYEDKKQFSIAQFNDTKDREKVLKNQRDILIAHLYKEKLADINTIKELISIENRTLYHILGQQGANYTKLNGSNPILDEEE